MEGIQIFKIVFDSMENSLDAAINETLLGTFIGNENLTAHGNASNFISKLEPMGVYLGWDGNVYPKIVIKKIEIQ